jgi:hypothetical protein
MSKTIERLLKRRCHNVTIAENDFWLKALTIADGNQIGKFQEQDSGTYWAIGRALVESDGAEVFPRMTDEPPEEYAKRIGVALVDMPQDTLAELMGEIVKLARTPSVEAIAKN